MDEPLLTGSGHTRADWEQAAAGVLRTAGRLAPGDPDELVWRVLTRTTLDGIAVPPLGTPDDVAGLPDPGAPGAAPYTRGSQPLPPGHGWDVRAHLAEPDPVRAAADALLDLENGVTSLWLSLGAGGTALPSLAQVLADVRLDVAPVALDCPDDPIGAAEAFCALVAERGLRPAPGTVLGVDPVGAGLRDTPDRPVRTGAAGPLDHANVVHRLAELAHQHSTLACTVDGTAVHDLGATDAQELGFTLAVGAALLRVLTDAGWPVADAAALLEFRYAATDEQFPTIAKLRAARRLWHRVLELSGAPDAAGQRQHAVTSRPMLTAYDPWVNMVRGTVACFAAGTAGATSVTVLPFDTALGLPDALARRNARNTSALLVHESHVAEVVDPAGGAWHLERLTADLAAAGWTQLQQIEADGGAVTSLGSDSGLVDRVRRQAAGPRRHQVVTRRRPITGVSEFPDLDERLPQRRPHPPGAPAVERYALPFERLRDEPRATPVFLATLGTVAEHGARAAFATTLLASGGVRTLAAGPTTGTEELLDAYRSAGGSAILPVVCLAGPDTAYADRGAGVVHALREAGARHVVLAGEPGARSVPAALFDDSCAADGDAVAFLVRLRRELPR